MPASCICRRSGTPLLCRQSQAQGGLLAGSQPGSTLEPGGNLPAPPKGCRTLVPAQPFTLEQWKGVFLPGLLCMVENRVPGCLVGVGITGCNCYPSWLLGKQLPCPHVEVSLLAVWFGWSQRTPLARRGFADLLRGAGRMHTPPAQTPAMLSRDARTQFPPQYHHGPGGTWPRSLLWGVQGSLRLWLMERKEFTPTSASRGVRRLSLM